MGRRHAEKGREPGRIGKKQREIEENKEKRREPMKAREFVHILFNTLHLKTTSIKKLREIEKKKKTEKGREAERIGERWKEKEKGKEWKRERRERGIMMKKGGVGGEKGGGCKGLLKKEKQIIIDAPVYGTGSKFNNHSTKLIHGCLILPPFFTLRNFAWADL